MERNMGQVSGLSISELHNFERDMINTPASTPKWPVQHCSFPYQSSTTYWTFLPLRPRLVHPSQFFSKVDLLNGQEGTHSRKQNVTREYVIIVFTHFYINVKFKKLKINMMNENKHIMRDNSVTL